MSEIVRDYYDANAEGEWLRLEHDRTELALTMRALRDHLPAPPARILDIGGGPGRYAIALAAQGYAVTLADISQPELDLAAERARAGNVQLRAIVQCDARDLSRLDPPFDAVLMLGPLYHLLSEHDRRSAVREAIRVLRSGGVMFAAFITRYAVLRFWARYDPARVAADFARYDGHLETGEVRDNFGFTDLYLARPQEVVPFMESLGLSTLDMVGLEGVISMIRDRVDELRGDDWERWVDINYRAGRDPSTHGCTEHLLYVGRTP